MNAFDHQEAWAMKPRLLSIEEIEQPEMVLEEFFQFAHLPQMRWYLRECMKTMVCGSFSQLRPNERSGMLCFYEQMEKLVEVAHVIHEKNKAVKP